MKKKMYKWYAVVLTVSMIIINCYPTTAAEMLEGSNTEIVNEKEIQPIDVSLEEQVELSQDDISYYQNIANEISDQSDLNGTLTIVDADAGITVYSVDDENSDEENIVIQEKKYSEDGADTVDLKSYSEIVVPQNISDENANVGQISNDEINYTIENDEISSNLLTESNVKTYDENKENVNGSDLEENWADLQTNEEDISNNQVTVSKTIVTTKEEEVAQETETSSEETNIETVFKSLVSVNESENEDIEKITVAQNMKIDASQGSSLAMDAIAQIASEKLGETENNIETTENPYINQNTVTVTAEELLERIKKNDDISLAFAKNLGFGSDKTEIEKNLQLIVDEYYANKDTFIEPRFEIHNVGIGIGKNVDEISLNKNADGSYSVSLNGSQKGYKTTITVESQASVTIVYDEKGTAEIERKVKSDKPTDFVITLDISGSMEEGGRDRAMFSALQTLLDEILQEPQNTVSIVLFATEGAVLQLDVDQNGIIQKFSGGEGHTSKLLYDSHLADDYGVTTSISLGQATIEQLESIYGTYAGTYPDSGLNQALKLLDALNNTSERNTGVILFTDGEAQNRWAEYDTVDLERKIAEQYGATIVNVSIGDENQVSAYERYLDPDSDSYYQKNNQALQDHVLYYNIPKLTDKELAQKVTQMFETAFEDITTEKRKLQTETITDGILAAYASTLIEKIPSGFEITEIENASGISYKVIGSDADGNTIISFDLSEILTDENITVSYCVIPIDNSNSIGVTAYKENADTVLYTEPINRIKDQGKVKIIYTGDAVKQTTVTTIQGQESHANTYNTTTDEASAKDDVEKYLKEYTDALEKYYSILQKESERKLGGTPEKLVNTGKFADQIRKNGWVTVKLSGSSDKDEKVVNAVYKAVAEIYKQLMKNTPQFSSIDFSNKSYIGIISSAAALINSVKDSVTKIDKVYIIDGYVIELNGMGIFSSGTSSITVTKNGQEISKGTFVTSIQKNQEVIAAYMDDLSEIVKDQTKEALFDVLSEFSEITGIRDFMKDSVKETLEDCEEGLKKAGFGDVLATYEHGRTIYEYTQTLNRILNNPNMNVLQFMKNSENLYKKIKEMNFKPEGVNSWAVSDAMNSLERARYNLESALFNYIYESDINNADKTHQKYDSEKNLWDRICDLFR